MVHAAHPTSRKAGLLGLAVAVACLAAPGPARAGHTLLEFQSALEELWAVDPALEPPPDNGSRDFAVGGFQGPSDNSFGFSAHSDPWGDDPRGHLSETIPGVGQARFRVTCVAVLGHQAALGLVPTEAASNDVPAERVLSVFDSGLPGGTGDRFKFYDVSADQCDAFVASATLPIVRGNLVVHDVVGP